LLPEKTKMELMEDRIKILEVAVAALRIDLDAQFPPTVYMAPDVKTPPTEYMPKPEQTEKITKLEKDSPF